MQEINWAYQLDEGRLLGAPRELDSTRFDVVAKSPEQEPIPGRMQLMMRALLAERFKLVVHHETRELTAYTLVTDTGGPKVRASGTTEPAGPNPFRMTDRGSLMGTRVTADMLATVLSNQLGRPVQNMTSFTGAFDYVLRWSPDTATAAIDVTERAKVPGGWLVISQFHVGGAPSVRERFGVMLRAVQRRPRYARSAQYSSAQWAR